MRRTPSVSAVLVALAAAIPAMAQDAPVTREVVRREAPAPAQDAPVAAPARPVGRQLIPTELQVVVARYQGEKRIGSVPYMLTVNAVAGGGLGNNVERTQLTIGSEVAVPTTTFTAQTDGKSTQPLRSFSYRNVGTVMSAAAVTADNGQYEVELQIDESSVGSNAFDGRGGSPAEMPVFKSFKARNRILLRPGQMRQFTAATDRVSGETVRIEVTLTVVK